MWRNGTCLRPINLNPEVQFVEHFPPLPEDCGKLINVPKLWRKGKCFETKESPNSVKYAELEPNGRIALHCYGSVVGLRNTAFDCPIKPFIIKPDMIDKVEVNGKKLSFGYDDRRITWQQQSPAKPVLVNDTG